MSYETVEPKVKSIKDLEEMIARAIKKVGAKRESDICTYLPEANGHMHHFTLKKLKSKQPKELGSKIEKFIINVDRPQKVPPKKRAPRGSRKQKDFIFTRTQLERMREIAKFAGDKDMVALLSPRRSLATCKRELIISIRHSSINQDLWDAYVEAVNTQQSFEKV